MTSASSAPATTISRLIACSQLCCVVLFGVLLFRPWQATAPALGAALILASVAFAIAAIFIARGAHGLVRVVFGAFALLALTLGAGGLWLLTAPASYRMRGRQDVTSRERAVRSAA